jgi:hypothetical protein
MTLSERLKMAWHIMRSGRVPQSELPPIWEGMDDDHEPHSGGWFANQTHEPPRFPHRGLERLMRRPASDGSSWRTRHKPARDWQEPGPSVALPS